MIKGTTKSGFRYEVKETIGKDFKILKLIRMTDKDPTRIFDLAVAILGEKQLSNLENYMEKRDGYVDTLKITKEIMEIFTGNPLLKNS